MGEPPARTRGAGVEERGGTGDEREWAEAQQEAEQGWDIMGLAPCKSFITFIPNKLRLVSHEKTCLKPLKTEIGFEIRFPCPKLRGTRPEQESEPTLPWGHLRRRDLRRLHRLHEEAAGSLGGGV